MATGDERDARLILRAEDRATKTFDAVAKSIANVREQLQQQAKAAESGQGSLDDLQRSYKELQAAGDSLVKQQSAIKSFQKTSEAVERTSERLEAARKALEDYQSKLAGQDKVTDAQTTKLQRLQAAVEKLTATYNTQAGRVDKAREALTGLGLSADQADEQLTATAQSAKLVAAGLLTAKKAIDDYDIGLKAAAAAAAELAARNKLLDEAAKVGVDTSQVASTEELTAAIERQRIALDEVAASEKAEAAASRIRREQLISTAKEVASGNPILEEQFALLERLADEEKRASGFRQLGQDAQAAATDLGRFGTTATESQASITRLADAIRQTVQPAVAEVQSLDGALKQVEESSGVAANAQKLRTSQYQDSLNKLKQAQAAFVNQAKGIDAFKAQQAALAGLEADLGEAAEKYRLLGVEVERAGPDAEQLAKQLAVARRELESIGTATQNAGTKLEQLGNNLKRVGINIDDLDGEFTRLQAGATRSAAAAEILTAKVGGNGKGFLGLKPYELQNLGFQINDVFTSLASGISPTQTLAQQGGQIVQIFPQVISTFIRLLPVLAPLAVGIGAIAYQLSQTKKAADAVKGFDAIFALSGNAAGLSAQQFGQAQIALERLGASSSDAKKALQAFIADGLDPSGLDAFIHTADTIAKVTGESLPEAAGKLGDAYSKGYKQIADLNDLLGGPLNDAQLQAIQNDFDAGKATEARTLAQQGFTKAAADAADKLKGPYTDSVKGLETAFGRFADAVHLSDIANRIAQEGIKTLTTLLDRLGGAAQDAANAYAFLNRAYAKVDAAQSTRFGLTGDYQKQLAANYVALGLNPDGTQIIPAKQPKRAGASARVVDPSAKTTGGQALLRDQQTQLKTAKLLTAQQRIQVAQQDAANKAAEAGASDVEIAQARVNAAKLEQSKIDKENEAAGKRAESAAAKAAREAETRQNKINSLTKELQDTFTKFTPENVANPFSKIQTDADNAVRDVRAKFAQLAKLGITLVDGKTEAQFEAQIRAYQDQQVQQQKLVDGEKALNALLTDRKTKLAEIEDQVASGALSPVEGLQKSKEVIDGTTDSIRQAAQQALTLAQALQTAHPSPELATQIETLKKQLQSVGDAANAADLKAISDKDIKAGFDQLNALTSARDEYVKLENQLVAAGLETSTDAQKKIKDAYDGATPSIVAQASAVQDLVDKAYLLGTVSFADYQKFTAQVQLATAETEHLTANQVALKNAATQALTSGITTFITSIGTALAGAIEGTKSLGDVFKSIGQAALSFAASFTQAIAQAILQILALQAAQAILRATSFLSSSGFGAFHEGGVVGTDAPTFRRKVPAEVFAGAIRYHTGGMVGLRPDEVPAILQKGEEVVTAADPRNRMNGGLMPAPAPVNLKLISTIDPREVLNEAANTDVGEKAIINAIGRNAQAVRAKLGV